MKIVSIFLSLLFPLIFFSQKSDSLQSKPHFVYYSANKIKVNGIKVEADYIREKLKDNPDLLDKFEDGKTCNSVGTVLTIGSGAIFSIALIMDGANHVLPTDEQRTKRINKTYLVSALVFASGITLKIIGNQSVKKSLEGYNNLEISVLGNANGFGLALKF